MLAGAPPGFLLGAATSAYQIEGGNRNDWTAWEKGRYPDGSPHVADGTDASRAADSWNLWRSDLAALQLLGANVYRMGIEWSRLEPAEGVWDEAAAARYREMFAALRAAHIHRWSRSITSRCRPGWRRAAAGSGRARRRRWRRSPAGRAPRSAIWSTGGARSTSRTCWWPRATWRRSGRPACAIRGARRWCWRRSCARTASWRARCAEATGSTPTATDTPPGSGSLRTCASSTPIRPTPSTRSSPGAPTASTTSRSSTPSRSVGCAWCCRA